MALSKTDWLLIDFQDSFTFNIASELLRHNQKVEVMSWKSFTSTTTSLSELRIILGPGPGHPDEYSQIFDPIKKLIALGTEIHGICLGLQIIGRTLGATVSKSADPIHGESVALKIPPWEVFKSYQGKVVEVQRYNSLALTTSSSSFFDKTCFVGEDLMLMSYSNGLGMQFHPESVGTECREAFFRALCYFETYAKNMPYIKN